MVDEYDFFDTPVTPYTVLQNGAELEIHVRDTETMEQSGVRCVVGRSLDDLTDGKGVKLNVYGRLGARFEEQWYIHVIEVSGEGALATDHVLAQSLDMEQSLKSPEQFRQSKYRKPKE